MADADPDLEEPTVSDHRSRVRELVESDVRGGYHPLRKHEVHRAYYALTGEKLDEPSNGEVRYRTLEVLQEDHGAEFDLRDPFDAGGPFTKPEIGALVDALEEEASDA